MKWFVYSLFLLLVTAIPAWPAGQKVSPVEVKICGAGTFFDQLAVTGLWHCGVPPLTPPAGGNYAIQYSSGGAFAGAIITGLVLGHGSISPPDAYAGTSGAAHQFLTALDPSGVGTFVRPVCADLSDAGAGCSGSAGGITQLTNDVTAGPGSGSQVATLANTGVVASAYTNTNLTVNSKGLITAASNGTSGGATSYGGIGWIAGSSPDKVPIFTASTATTVTDIRGKVAVPVGATATISIFKAGSPSACSAGTNLIAAAGTFDANGAANTNINLTLAGAGAPSLIAGDSVCLSTSNSAAFAAGNGIGGITITYTVP